MVDILLKGGLLIDPSQGIHKKGSVAIQDGKIVAVGEDTSKAEAEKVFNMEGKIIAPGLIDIHCHPAAGFAWLGAPAGREDFPYHADVFSVRNFRHQRVFLPCRFFHLHDLFSNSNAMWLTITSGLPCKVGSVP